jgi:hypothetical protein
MSFSSNIVPNFAQISNAGLEFRKSNQDALRCNALDVSTGFAGYAYMMLKVKCIISSNHVAL